MDSIILAYLAGIVDGEGSINITQYKTRGGNIRWMPSVAVGMVDKEPIELFSKTFDFNINIGKAKSGRPTYSCKAAWRGCKRVLEQLYPYLRNKKDLAKLVMDFCDHVSEYPRINPFPALRSKQGKILKGSKINLLSVAEVEYRQGIYLKVKSIIYGKSNTIHRQRLSEEAVEKQKLLMQ
jgi:hypothetical protein